ncbi:MAG: glycosyltransferase family 4 protein [Lachnospiraceae bacterium]|nr:glycosyltransferase family 4 protein [Lachnospiraceae bacterium]
MKICFLLSYVPNPRMNKRIALFKQLGYVSVVCARRKSQDIWEPEQEDIIHFIYDIDLPSFRHVLRRVYLSNKFKNLAFKKINEIQPDIIYVEGLDCLQIANAYQKDRDIKIIYEVADLRECFIEKKKTFVDYIFSRTIVSMEKRYTRKISLLVVTSELFYEKYYNQWIDKDCVVFMPNIPDSKIFKNYHKKRKGIFTVGFIGGIRYLQQMKMLVNAAEKAGCNILFAGAGGTSNEYEEINQYCRNKSFVSFTGRYDYKRDIANLYGKVDCVYSVYDADNSNVRIALPNKLYEAILCGLPIIVSKGTYLSGLVEQWGVGIAVDHKNEEELVEALNRLCKEKEYYHSIEYCCREHRNMIDLEKYNRYLLDKVKAFS